MVGLAIAHRLASDGREVVVLDPEAPGSGASYGNAGTIADYAVNPVGTPAVLKNLPSLLFNRDSPLAIRRAALPALAPWLLRFAWQSLPGAARRNAEALAALLADAAPRWRDLAGEILAADLLRDRGCLYLYEAERDRRAAEADMARRRDLGVAVEMLSPAELAALEPGLPPLEGGAAFFPNALFVTDPGELVARLATAAQGQHARIRRARVTELAPGTDHVNLSGDGFSLRARHAVIAAGAHSRQLARQAGHDVPLDTERGYHLEFDMVKPPITRPSCPGTRGFYLCPMKGRLRVAGTVELGGLTSPPSPHRLALLEEGARALYPDLPAPDRSWMGFRPSMPDSLPVIGRTRHGDSVIYAFGHGHIGLTLAPVTAEIVAGVLLRNDALPAARPFDPRRFG